VASADGVKAAVAAVAEAVAVTAAVDSHAGKVTGLSSEHCEVQSALRRRSLDGGGKRVHRPSHHSIAVAARLDAFGDLRSRRIALGALQSGGDFS